MRFSERMSLRMSEKDWQALVVEYARYNAWMVFHVFDSRRSEPGYPDLTLLRGSECIVAELKAEKGKVRADQHKWLEAFAEAGIEAHVWRPSDWSLIEGRLRRKRVRVDA